ncbi:hypothetical protein Tco_0315795 [Tanacetum coccineum]
MFLYMDQLQKQLDNEEFQEIGFMSAFKVLETQFQMFIKSQIYLDDEYVDMTHNKFLQITRLDIPEFHDTLIQHMESVKKSIGERAQHKMEERSSDIIESNGTESKEAMAEVLKMLMLMYPATGDIRITEQLNSIMKEKVDQNADNNVMDILLCCEIN